MSLKSDAWIKSKCLDLPEGVLPMLEPFFPESINTLESGRKIPSYGLSSYGYDVRLGRNFKFFKQQGVVERDHFTGLTNTKELFPYAKFVSYSANGLQTHPIPVSRSIIDPCDFDESVIENIPDADFIVMPPLSFCLGVAMDKVRVPRDVSVVCMGKSTIARAGIIVTVTPLEAGWEGYITLEITNTTMLPVRLTAGMGITQLQFFHHQEEQCEVSYADRNGKYQNQPLEAIPARL